MTTAFPAARMLIDAMTSAVQAAERRLQGIFAVRERLAQQYGSAGLR